MNRPALIIFILFLTTFFQAAVLSSSSGDRSGCVKLTIAQEGTIVVRFALPEILATPPWDPDALANYGFSLEKHGALPYFPVRPVALEVSSRAVHVEVLEAKIAEAPDVILQVSETPQPSVESDILLAPTSSRPIPMSVFPESPFPNQHVFVERPIVFGERLIARAKIYPFAYDEKRSALVRADSLVFRISPLHSGPVEESGAKSVKYLMASRTEIARPLILNVPADGIYAVPAEDLFPWWGGDSLPLSELSLKCQGQDVAYCVRGDGDELLVAGEAILFYGTGGDNTFTGDNAYWLIQGEGRVAMQSQSRPPPGEGSVTQLPRGLRFEQSHWMYEAQPPGTGDDHWFWKKIIAPEEVEVEIELRNLANSPDCRAGLRVALQGATSSHSTHVSINGNSLAEEQWEKLVPQVIQAEFSQGILHEGTNIVTIEEVSEEDEADVVYLDWIEVQYDSRLLADGDQLVVTVPANVRGIIVSGLQNEDVLIFDVTEQRTPYFIEDFTTTSVDGNYRVEFGTMASSERTYIILCCGSAKHPSSIRQRSASTWSNPENGADWIIVTHWEFIDGATRLASHRESQGLRTAVVDVQDVYDEFGYAVTSPEAIREFARFAYENWKPPAPRYLLLFGNGHVDYMNWLGTDQPNFIPPHYSWIPPIGWAPDDDWYGCVEGDDPFPEVFVGRLPVQSPAEAEAVVDKITSYDSVSVPQEWQRRVTFCAGAGRTFQTICRSLAEGPPPNFERLFLFRDDYSDPVSLKENILNSLEAGSLLFFYVGHGSVERWSEKVLHISDVPLLTNATRLPVMCMLTCLTGYFAVPGRECLAEDFIRATNGGAVACIAPTATGYPSEHLILGQGIVRGLFGGTTLGQCLAEAKISSYARGLSESFLRGFGLIGDPATSPRFVPATPDLIWFF